MDVGSPCSIRLMEQIKCSCAVQGRSAPYARSMSDVKMMRLRYAGTCRCGTAVAKGERAGWDRAAREVVCLACLESATAPTEINPGAPGASLEREYLRRKAVRGARVMKRFPRAGKLMLRLAGPVQTTEAFATGAEGEREVARLLEKELGTEALVLYNRRRGTGREPGDIDILVTTAAGVFIIDPKKYAGKRVRARRGTFIVDGRRRPQLAVSMRRQIDVVSTAMAVSEFADVQIRAAYCFLGADLRWRPLQVDGVPALGPRGTIRLLKTPGDIDQGRQHAIHTLLSREFPPA